MNFPGQRDYEDVDQPNLELSAREKDMIDVHLAEVVALAATITTPEEIQRRLLEAKIEVAKRQAVKQHRLEEAPGLEAAPGTRKGLRGIRIALLGALTAEVVLFTVSFPKGPLDAVTLAVSTALVAFLTSPTRATRRTRARSRQAGRQYQEQWWWNELQDLAKENPEHRHGRYTRVLDVVFATSSLLLLAPVFLLLGVVIAAQGRSPVVSGDPRVGAGARVFQLRRFAVRRHPDGSPRTQLDRMLDVTGFEELPSLWNLLLGDVTLVGPKPEVPGLAVRYPRSCRWVFQYRPGLAGPATVASAQTGAGAGSDIAAYLESVVPAQVDADRSYLKQPRKDKAKLIAYALIRLVVLRTPKFLSTSKSREAMILEKDVRVRETAADAAQEARGIIRWSEQESGVLA